MGPQQLIKFEYDPKNRRIRKQVWPNTTGSGNPTNDVKFVYDGWNLVSIINSPSSLQQSFMWGLDLSGSLHGAGGVGGLLELVYYGTQTTNSFATFDGNGNVCGLMNAADATSLLQYEYGPFGEVIRTTGQFGKANQFRFCTKLYDDDLDLVYYGVRYYSPVSGTWKNRDPFEESGGLNIYGFVSNDPLNAIDPFGLDIIVACPQPYFSSLGLEEGRDYQSVGGNRWRAKVTANLNLAGNLDKEIVWEMLIAGADRVFTAKGLDVEQLKRNVAARKNVVAAVPKVTWQFLSDKDSPKVNPAFWTQPWVLKTGVTAYDAVGDLFAAGAADRYGSGCRYGSLFALLEGIRETVSAAEFNQINTAQGAFIEDQARNSGVVRYQGGRVTWVAGDRGYVEVEGSGHGINGGQWLIYLGLDKFWGFGANPSIRSLQQWIKADGPDSGKRYFPGTGLEKP